MNFTVLPCRLQWRISLNFPNLPFA